MIGNMALSKDFKEFIESLNERSVQYLIVGAYAVAFHGHPRYTKDIDIWIERSDENIDRLLKALTDFGLGSLGFQKEDFSNPEMIVQIGVPPNRIDILSDLEGLIFSTAFQNRKEVDLYGIKIAVIGLDDLRISKKAAGRPRDIADLADLQ
jgi:predicted nucleotidyltransferase